MILFGEAFLLMLPVSSLEKVPTPFHEALFYSHFGSMRYRACSKGQRKLLVCVRTDSYSCAYTNRWTWSSNRSGSGFAFFQGKKISLMQRSTMQDAISAPKVGGIVRLTRFILRGTFLIELLGALAVLPVFCRDYGWRASGWRYSIPYLLFATPGLVFLGQKATAIHLLPATRTAR